MSELVPRSEIEETVGAPRHRQAHYGRAVTVEQTVYILHSKRCLESGIDLRDCRFSVALDKGIELGNWEGKTDTPVVLGVWNGRLIPIAKVEADHG